MKSEALLRLVLTPGTKRWVMWAFMQSLWENDIEPTNAMLESFWRKMYPNEQFKSGNLCELAYLRHTVTQQLPAPEKQPKTA